jgi:hypothetical protein
MSGPTPQVGNGDPGLRTRAVRAAGISSAAALAVLVAGLLIVMRGPEPAEIGAEATPAVQPAGPGSGSPTPPVARITLSASGTRLSPVVWQVGLGGDRGRNAVLVAYQAYVGATVRLAEEPDPDDAALPQVALDPQLGRLRRALGASATAGLTRRGRVLAVARVEVVRGGQAIVVGCLDAASQQLLGPAGRPVPRWRGGVSVSRVRMRKDDGRWKVYLLTALPVGRCRA